MKLKTLLENNTTMSITDIFSLVGCDSGNGKFRKKNEYIRYHLKEEWTEFKNDIKQNGVKAVIQLKSTDGKLCIVDGYHRITALKELLDSKEIKNIQVKVEITVVKNKTVDLGDF